MVMTMKAVPFAFCVTVGLVALAAWDVKAAPGGSFAAPGSMIYAEQPKDDQGVSGRCAKIANPAERRKCMQSSG